MNGYMVLLLVAALITLGVSRIARQITFHPFQTGFNAIKDLYYYQLHRGWHNCPVGALDIYCGYFGSGKTLSLVHKVVGLYNCYNDKVVWCPPAQKICCAENQHSFKCGFGCSVHKIRKSCAGR